MLIKCKECGSEISSMAQNCPKCGCPNNISKKSKLSIASFVLAIIDIFYVCMLMFSPHLQRDELPPFIFLISILAFLSFIFGFISFKKTTNDKKSIIGMVLSIISVIVSIIVYAL